MDGSWLEGLQQFEWRDFHTLLLSFRKHLETDRSIILNKNIQTENLIENRIFRETRPSQQLHRQKSGKDWLSSGVSEITEKCWLVEFPIFLKWPTPIKRITWVFTPLSNDLILLKSRNLNIWDGSFLFSALERSLVRAVCWSLRLCHHCVLCALR